MPRLMDKTDWMQTVADVGVAENVWCESVAGDSGNVSFSLPERGRYRVILVKLDGVYNPQSVSRDLPKRNVSPKVRALRGAAKLNDNREYKDMLADALMERYEALG